MTLHTLIALLIKVYPKWEGSICGTYKIDTPICLNIYTLQIKIQVQFPSKCYPTILPSNLFKPSNSELFFFKTEK